MALVAASILPAQSEAAVVAMIATGHSPFAVVVVATLGNVAGSEVNWGLGRGIDRFGNRRWFPVGEAALERVRNWYHRHGRWSLLLSWVPVVGDPLTVIAGVLREPLGVFLALVTVAKAARYVVLALGAAALA